MSKVILFGAIVAIIATGVSAQFKFRDQRDENPFPQQRYVLGKMKNEDPEFYYLPKTMTPNFYEVVLEPSFDTNTFSGNVSIRGYNDESINEIVLHSLDLVIWKVKVLVNDVLAHNLNSFDADREFLIIALEETVAPGSTILVQIGFYGHLGTTMRTRGFYIAEYLDEFNQLRRLATTHLEPTSAREVFPCFDEPALKAQIGMSIVRPRHYNSKTNMPLAYTHSWIYDDSKEIDVYNLSPPMSTYLVAVVVSEFGTISSTYPDQAIHELHGDIADLKKNYGDLGLYTSRQALSALEEYTGINFSLPKIGQVAIPEGYFGGAMENWGLVIYGESSLLFKPNVSTEIQREGVANIISHEYAHQWFGNLVGPASWAYTWLNEGFATYFTMIIPTIINPSWRTDDQFGRKIPYAMTYDGMAETRPMTMPVGHPDNIQATFDVIAYDKAACVIRMFEHILGTENFRAALNLYLTNRQYAGATADDLISSFATVLENEGDTNLAENIKTMFDSWHLQKGFPLVTATRNYENNTLTLTQERYISDGSQSDELYHIPINYFFESSTAEEKADTRAQVWLDQKEITIELPAEAKDSYVILNKQYTGYYRVNYDEINWMRIVENANSFLDMPKNRVQLLEDVFEFLRSGRMKAVFALALMTNIQLADDNYMVTKASIQYFDWIYERLHTVPEAMDNLILVFRKAFDTYAHVQDDGDYVHTLMRDELITRMCRIHDPICLSQMQHHMRQDYVLQSPNLQHSVVCAGLMNSQNAEENFNFVLEQMQNSYEYEIFNRFMLALPCTKDEKMGKQLLDWIVYPNTNYLSWNPYVLLANYCQDYENAAMALAYYLEKFTTLTQSYSLESMTRFVNAIAHQLHMIQNIETIENFVASSVLTEEYKIMFEGAIKMIQTNIDRIQIPLE